MVDPLQIGSCFGHNFVVFKTQGVKYTLQISLKKVLQKLRSAVWEAESTVSAEGVLSTACIMPE